MRLLVIGINHSTASLELRERLAFTPDQLAPALRSLNHHLSSYDESANAEAAKSEAVIISTCNRTELVMSASSSQQYVLSWLTGIKRIDHDDFSEHVYCYEAEDAVKHLIKVAGGLDSMILGEPQIFGQMKSAYAVSRGVCAINNELEAVFQHVFAVAKKVRSDTAIGENPVSVAYAAVSLAQRIFADLSSVSVLLIGAGDTIELVAQHLKQSGAKRLVVANRTLDRAQSLAERLDAKAILLSDVPDNLAQFDIVISSTASQLPVLGKGAVESALNDRKRRPMLLVDIAVPRDIEKEVAQLSDIYLYTVDDLRDIIDHNVRLREAEVDKAGQIIDQGVEEFLVWQRSRDATDLVVSYRAAIQNLHDDELDRAKQLLEKGKSPELALESLARSLIQKIMHQPTVEMRNAAGVDNQDLLNAAKVLFGLDDEFDNNKRNEKIASSQSNDND